MKKSNKTNHSQYGIKTVAKDGVEYKSRLEAGFVDKFLVGSGISYEYEKTYPETRFRCDFYLSDLDIWIELTYHKIEEAKIWETKNMVELPRAEYRHRHIIKSHGGCWNPKKKVWYVIRKDNDINKTSITKLEKFMHQNDKQRVILSKKSISSVYNETLSKKVKLNDSVIVVDKEDIEKYKDLSMILIAKKNNACMRKVVRQYFSLQKEKTNGP